jgi:thiol:disulfide interchange protein DsbD
MRTSRIFLTSFVCLLLLLWGCTKATPQPAAEPSASPQQPVEGKRIASVDVVQATPQPFAVSAGSSGEATVRLTIQSGYHVNANPPTYSYLKATELEIDPGDGISVGQVKYPVALNKKFLFAEKPLAVYEGETGLKVKISADKSAKPGERSLSAKLRIQACDDQVCYPPGTLNLSIPVSIK